MAQTVAGAGASGDASFVVVLGVEARLAGELAAARGLSLAEGDAQDIGIGCARCFRLDCRQRSLPPRGARLQIDRITRGLTPEIGRAWCRAPECQSVKHSVVPGTF